jgi:hypothetical protein
MTAKEAKTYETVDAIDEGGSYEVRDGRFVRVVEPTAPRAVEPAEAGPGAAVGAASGEPQARVEGKPAKPAAAR